MTFLKDFSIIWSLVHTLVLFLLLFESRFPKRKLLRLTASFILPLIALNFVLFLLIGADRYMKLMLITLSLPSFVFFWFLAKYRGGRFVFTFCMVDTLVLELIYITNIIDRYIPGDWFLFLSRLVAYPLIEWLVYARFKTIYRKVQNEVQKGWWIFALTGVLFYIAITLALNFHSGSSAHPEHMSVFLILLVLMPISYLNIFNTLRHQQSAFESKEQENLLKVQVATVQSRIQEYSDSNALFSKERHDFRHKLQTICRLVEMKKYDELLTTVSKYNEMLDETKMKKYCENAVLDAVFSSYLHKAELAGISVTTALYFPDPLPVNEVELATALANAIENAIHAQDSVEEGLRHIEIKSIASPQFMLEVKNTIGAAVKFDADGVPVTEAAGHGFGTRSIVAFCEKYDAFYEFKTQDDQFVLRILF
ncbi:MAG: GHKL domain-containing protein [Oscillospiraceae bacterium]|nr:GHKL domain-containing protein [Oscillospiraceae bacterium]